MSELSTTNSQPARTVEAVTLEIQTLQRQAQQLLLGYAIEIGRRLVEVKAMLPHGQWGTYIKEQVGYSQSTANNLMRIFEEYGTAQQSIFGPEAISQAIGNLSYTNIEDTSDSMTADNGKTRRWGNLSVQFYAQKPQRRPA